MKKRVFICSPYRGDIGENTKRAAYYARIITGAGEIPIAPHLYFPSFLDEKNPNERMTGIEMGLELMDLCDEVRVFGFVITEGMKSELSHAREKRKPVKLYDADFNPVNIKALDSDERVTLKYRMAVTDLRLLK